MNKTVIKGRAIALVSRLRAMSVGVEASADGGCSEITAPRSKRI